MKNGKSTYFLGFMVLLLWTQQVVAQRYLVLDKYSHSRIKLMVGDDVRFRLKGSRAVFNDVIVSLGDSSLFVAGFQEPIYLREFDKFYFPRNGAQFISAGTAFMGSGFLFAAAVEPLVPNNVYDRRESAYLGGFFMGTSLLTRLIKTKKFKVNRNTRVRIIETNPLTR